jgi:hypothetical protein
MNNKPVLNVNPPMPWIGTQLWERVSPQTPFWTALTASLISIVVVWMKFKLLKSDSTIAPLS